MKTAERGYGSKWQRARKRFLAEHPFCIRCRELGLIVAATVVDHVISHNGDPVLFWNEDNWQSLCVTCHSKHKQREENRARYRRD